MKYILKTTYPCLVKTKDSECQLDENDLLEIEDESALYVYPENPRQIPFYINLLAPKESDFLSIFSRDGVVFLVLEKWQNLKVLHKETLFFGGKKCVISVESQNISFETETKKVSFECPHPCKDFKIFKLRGFACVQFEKDLYAYSLSRNKLSHFGGQVQVDGDVVTLTKNFHDSENREREAKYRFEEDISMEEEHFTHNSIVPADELVPFKIMESVKAKDFEYAHSFLSENLKNQIENSQIGELFGDFSTFLPLSTTEFITIKGKQKNFVKFSIHGNLIDDISVDGL